MFNTVIRRATPQDIAGICRVNRGEEGPWALLDSCADWVINRLNHGFYVQVAEREGQILAHGEWILSDEHRGRTFYLSQLQVDPDFQFQGIGRQMLKDGIDHARVASCESITLIPEQGTHSELFYEKCGFARGPKIWSCRLPAQPGRYSGRRVDQAPFSVVRELQFVFGLCQTAAHHMWQVFNCPPKGNNRRVDTLLDDGVCIQLGGFARNEDALALVWSDGRDPAARISQALAFAHALGYPGVNFYFFAGQKHFFPADSCVVDGFEMVKRL